MKQQYNNYTKGILLLFVVCPFFFGMYYEFCGAVVAAAIAVVLLWRLTQTGSLKFEWSIGTVLCVLFLMGYIITIPYAVDSGMAFLGVFRILWILLFLLGYKQLKAPEKEKIFHTIPLTGFLMCMVGFAAYFIPVLKKYMYANNRLGGGFQYPNTFALFLLTGIILLCSKKQLKKVEYLFIAALLAGICLSGSRTVFVLTVLTFFILIIKNRNLKLLFGIGVLISALSIFVLVTGDVSNIGRIATFSFMDSTLVGRALYAKDALPLLLHHPFGMGHLGYYYMENGIQTGVYSIKYVHNDWLQLGLDIGWVPMLLYGAAVIKTLLSKTVTGTNKMILAVIFLHGLLDFDLSYSIMLCIVFMIMEEAEWKHFKYLREARYLIKPQCAVISLVFGMVVCIYISIPLLYYYNNNMEMAEKYYPWYTEAKLSLLSESEDIDEVEQLAEEILNGNDTCTLAYYAKAMAAYCEDDYEKVILYQREAIARDYFNYDVYLNFAYMLYDGVLYYENTDEKMYETCRKELLKIPDYLEDAEGKLSRLGSMIDDQPELSVDGKLYEMLKMIQE